MSEVAKYCVIELYPNRERLEIITVGILVRFENKWDVRVLSDLKKIIALNPLYPTDGIISMATTMKSLLADFNSFEDARKFLLKMGGSPGLQEFVGQFPASSEQQFNNEIEWLLSELVLPPCIHQESHKPALGQNRLRTRLRRQFKNRHLLAARGDKIDDHKVIEKFPIAANQGLFAEFALKNGVMHITETVDFEVGESSKRHKIIEAQAKTLILSAAKQHLGNNTKTYVVVAGSNRNTAKPSINLLSDYADVFALESSNDMGRYFERIYQAAQAPQGMLRNF